MIWPSSVEVTGRRNPIAHHFDPAVAREDDPADDVGDRERRGEKGEHRERQQDRDEVGHRSTPVFTARYVRVFTTPSVGRGP
jgi:hypothetical protein